MLHQVVSGIRQELCGVLMSNKYWQALAESRNKISIDELKEVGDRGHQTCFWGIKVCSVP